MSAWEGMMSLTPRQWVCGAAVIGAMVLSPVAQAGRTCEPQAPTVHTVQQSLGLAARTVQQLNASGAQVVVLARVGQNLKSYGLRYSHLGLAYKDTEGWRVLHKLNACGTDQASVFRQGVGDFFMDGLHEYTAGILMPTPEVQARLLPLLKDGRAQTFVHSSAYSMLAYPWATRYQQSNQWALEFMAATLGTDVRTRSEAQQWLKQAGYEPTELKVNMFKRLGARATMANVALDDHPNELRYSSRIQTVTVDSVFTWMQRRGLAGPEWVVR